MVLVSTAAFHARVQGSVPGLAGLKETKKNFPHPRVKGSIVMSLRDREVACSASYPCLEDSVISIISPSSGGSPGPVVPIWAKRWPEAPFISFYFLTTQNTPVKLLNPAIIISKFDSVMVTQ